MGFRRCIMSTLCLCHDLTAPGRRTVRKRFKCLCQIICHLPSMFKTCVCTVYSSQWFESIWSLGTKTSEGPIQHRLQQFICITRSPRKTLLTTKCCFLVDKKANIVDEHARTSGVFHSILSWCSIASMHR